MKRGTPEHPKVYDLMEILSRRRPEVLGYLELLWQFTSKYTPRGDVGRFSDARIEAACDWRGRKGALIDGLVRSRWIDRDSTHRLVIHDWEAHADETVKRRLSRDKTNFISFQPLTENMSGILTDTVKLNSSGKTGLCTPTGTPMSTGTSTPPAVAADAAVLELSPPNGTEKKQRAPNSPSAVESVNFQQFYKLYPRHVGRGAALKAYRHAIQTTAHEEILDGLKRLLPSLLESDEQYRAHPATWLNARRWEDETPAARKPKHDEWDDL
jgi:hypothetical protein